MKELYLIFRQRKKKLGSRSEFRGLLDPNSIEYGSKTLAGKAIIKHVNYQFFVKGFRTVPYRFCVPRSVCSKFPRVPKLIEVFFSHVVCNGCAVLIIKTVPMYAVYLLDRNINVVKAFSVVFILFSWPRVDRLCCRRRIPEIQIFFHLVFYISLLPYTIR